MNDRSPVPPHLTLRYRVGEFTRRLWQKSVEDDVFFMAGAIAFNMLVALVPLLILGIGLTGYILSARFGDPTDAILALVADNLPQAGDGVVLVEALRAPIASMVERRTGFTVLGAVFFIWISTRLVTTLRIALREIFDIGQQRGIVMGKLFDIQVVLIGVALLTLNLGVTVLSETTMAYGGGLIGADDATLSFAQRVLGHTLALGSIWTLFLISYRYLPARRIPWRTAWIAATFSALLHEGLKSGFSWYATEIADYGSALGNLATVAVLFFWIYYGSIVFILGGEVAQVYTMRKASRVGVMSFEAEG
ncbi:MAG TPA: YihY/virulence factor BrkB family protein [Gemmatimonadetes bacterium]|nr:YihY/virulence factor BrkB family protein [Gemmatimonadota bacterium]